MSRNLKIRKNCLILHSQNREITDRVTMCFECEAKGGITIPLNKNEKMCYRSNWYL